MPTGKMWIYQLLFVFVRFTDFSGQDITLVASNFAGWFRGVLGRESPIMGNFAPL